MASVTIDRIDGVRRDIADAVIRTAPGSTLPEPEQERLLTQACVETCQLLTDWVNSPRWEDLDQAQDASLRELLQDQEPLSELLGPLFGDALDRAADRGGDDDAASAERLNAARAEAERAVRGALATSRRYPRMRCEQLLTVAIERVGRLQGQVCELAGQLSTSQHHADRVRKMRAVLLKASAFLLTLTVTMAGPGQVIRDVSVWTDEVKVVVLHDLAVQAQPGIRIAPPSAGPRVR
jgi:hypothetical protein